MRWNSGDDVPLGPGPPAWTGTARGATVLAQTTGSTWDGLRGFGSIVGSPTVATTSRQSPAARSSRTRAPGSSRDTASWARSATPTSGAAWASISTWVR